MSFFRYEAVDRAGKIVMGTMDAPTEAHVSAKLAQMGYRPQRVMAAQGAGAPAAPNPSTLSGVVSPANAAAFANTTGARNLPPTAQGVVSKLSGVQPKDLALFFRQFAALVRSGISLYQALESLGPRTRQPALSQTAREMADAARVGGKISDIMARYPRVFAEHVVGTVRAGEQGGFLDIVLDSIALDYEQEVAFYKGMWLGKWLVAQGLLALAIGQPLFPDLFPPPSNWPLYLMHVFLRNIPIMLILCAMGWATVYWLNLPENRLRRDRIALNTPVFGNLARQRSLAAFCRTLYQLFRAGIGPISAWEGAMSVAPNAVIREKLVVAFDMVQKGVPIHDAFAQTRLFADETEQLLATGVVSGAVVDMMDRVATYYQDNVDRAFTSARFWMFRLFFSLTIALGGALVIILTKTYFNSLFHFTDGWTD